MRNLLLLLSLIQLAACKGEPPTGSPADAGAEPDAVGAGLPPPVAPCDVLGFPGPPSARVAAGSFRLADIDGDGKLDLVVVRFDGDSVSVSPGNGDTSFRSSIDSLLDLPAIRSIASTAIVDLDGDGKLDLVVANSAFQASSVKVLLGDGSGRFQPGINYPTDSVEAIAVADLDGDGKPDLVMVGRDADTVKVRLGNGDGTFGDQTAYSVGQSPTAVAVVDLDGDGIPDVIVTNYRDATVSILRGNGNGTLNAKLDRDTASFPSEIATTDLNGDGKVDLVIRGLSQSLSVLINDGTGVLRDHVDYTVDALAALAVGDLDRDGKVDVVATGGGRLTVLAGNGDGTFQPAAATAIPSGARGLALGDVSGDNALDVIWMNGVNVATVSVLESDGSGGLLSPITYAVDSHSAAVAAVDLNGDGRVDLVLTGDNSVDIAVGRSDGEFGDPVRHPVNGPFGRVVVADVSGDGIVDLVVATAVPNLAGVSVLRGNGDGTFRDPVDTAFTVAGRYMFAVGDLSGDGKPDILLAESFHLTLHLGNGDGTFHSTGTNLASIYGSGYDALAVDDLDGDGRLDAVVSYTQRCAECGPQARGVDVMLNRGGGVLEASFHTPLPASSIAVADLDGDGKLDVVTTNAGVFVWRGSGDGTLQPSVTYASDGSGILQIVDITGDGKLDLVQAGVLNILAGNGDGSFQAAMRYPTIVGGPAAIADVNLDGRLDIITPGDTFNVLFARCVR